MKILLAASPSFTSDDKLQARLDQLRTRRPDAEIHIITQQHFTKIVLAYTKAIVHPRDFAMYAGGATTKAYEAILEHADGAVIFWDGESKPEANLIRMCAERYIKSDVIRFESLKQEIDRLKREGKSTKRKPKVILQIPSWCRDKYVEAHKENQDRNTPEAIKDHGYVKTKIPRGTTNGLTEFLFNYFNWKGHHLERISNQGVYRNGNWTKGSGTNGTSDTGGHFNNPRHAFAIPIKPEVKTGKDELSPDQIWFAKKMERTGAIQTVISCFEDVFKFYDYLESL